MGRFSGLRKLFERRLRSALSLDDSLEELQVAMLVQRRILAERSERKPIDPSAAACLTKPYSVEQAFERLRESAPNAFPIWRECFEAAARSYEGFPTDSCSVASHRMAELFGCFLRPYWDGRLLDVGCGPQPIPSYLEGYPLNQLYGIDPISEASDHPFHFVQAVAEFLPFEDGQFQVVVAATSLDHVLLLDRTFDEISRVLERDGIFVAWVSFIQSSAPYDPLAQVVKKADELHLFHFAQDWFDAAWQGHFQLVEATHLKGSSFYALRVKQPHD